MRYLIFNVTVLAALGYLFMASPDQSFTSWIGKAPKCSTRHEQPAVIHTW